MITFYDRERKPIMVLSDFSFNNETIPSIHFSVNISYFFYKVSREIENYKVYFDDFLNELNLLYEGKIELAKFVPIERELEIYFRQLDFGHILGTIKVNRFDIDDIMLESTLIIQYKIDQSFLPELIQKFSAVLDNYNLE